MNQHVELVRKWLADNDSVSQEELVANAKSADAYAAATAYAAFFASTADAADAKYWVERYDKITKEIDQT